MRRLVTGRCDAGRSRPGTPPVRMLHGDDRDDRDDDAEGGTDETGEAFPTAPPGELAGPATARVQTSMPSRRAER